MAPADCSTQLRTTRLTPPPASYVRDGEDPIFCDNGIHLFRQVASTGEHKVLV